jgi:hypothetical protein
MFSILGRKCDHVTTKVQVYGMISMDECGASICQCIIIFHFIPFIFHTCGRVAEPKQVAHRIVERNIKRC